MQLDFLGIYLFASFSSFLFVYLKKYLGQDTHIIYYWEAKPIGFNMHVRVWGQSW